MDTVISEDLFADLQTSPCVRFHGISQDASCVSIIKSFLSSVIGTIPEDSISFEKITGKQKIEIVLPGQSAEAKEKIRERLERKLKVKDTLIIVK